MTHKETVAVSVVGTDRGPAIIQKSDAENSLLQLTPDQAWDLAIALLREAARSRREAV